MQVRISSVAISVQRCTGIGCYPLSGVYRDKLIIIHMLGGMSCLDGVQCFFRQERDGRGGGSEQRQEVLRAATCASVYEPSLSDLPDSEASGVKEGADVDNVCVQESEITEGLLDEDVALDGVVSTLSEVTVWSPPCSASTILQAAPVTKALRCDTPRSSETRIKEKPLHIEEYCHVEEKPLHIECHDQKFEDTSEKSGSPSPAGGRRPQKIQNLKCQVKRGDSPWSSVTPLGELTMVGNHIWYGPGTQSSSPHDIIPNAAAAMRSLHLLAAEAQAKFYESARYHS